MFLDFKIMQKKFKKYKTKKYKIKKEIKEYLTSKNNIKLESILNQNNLI